MILSNFVVSFSFCVVFFVGGSFKQYDRVFSDVLRKKLFLRKAYYTFLYLTNFNVFA